MTENMTMEQGVMDEQVAQLEAEQVSSAAEDEARAAEHIAELEREADLELKAVQKALRSGNRESALSMYVAGYHALRFINLERQTGKSRAWCIDQLEREFSKWLDRAKDANLVLRTYAAMAHFHGDLTPPAPKCSKEIRKAWVDRCETLPPLSHFVQGYSQLVERREVDRIETWVPLEGGEEACHEFYAETLNAHYNREDSVDNGKVVEKGLLTRVREFLAKYLRDKAERMSEAARELNEAKQEANAEVEAAVAIANEQQTAVKTLVAEAEKAETPEAKEAKLAAAREADKTLQAYRKELQERMEAARKLANEAKNTANEAKEAEEKAEKLEEKVQRKAKKAEADSGRELPWQAKAEEAAKNAVAKDFAGAMWQIIRCHEEWEDVVAMIVALAKRDGDAAFAMKEAAAAFGITWDRVNKAAK